MVNYNTEIHPQGDSSNEGGGKNNNPPMKTASTIVKLTSNLSNPEPTSKQNP